MSLLDLYALQHTHRPQHNVNYLCRHIRTWVTKTVSIQTPPAHSIVSGDTCIYWMPWWIHLQGNGSQTGRCKFAWCVSSSCSFITSKWIHTSDHLVIRIFPATIWCHITTSLWPNEYGIELHAVGSRPGHLWSYSISHQLLSFYSHLMTRKGSFLFWNALIFQNINSELRSPCGEM